MGKPFLSEIREVHKQLAEFSMHDFDILFFRPLKTRLNKEEKRTLKAILHEIYKGIPAQYETLADFELCKQQLLALLDYITALDQSRLDLFVRYRKKVDELTHINAIPDIKITLKAAKKSIESCLLAIIKNHAQVDKTALGNLVVEKCYAGAFSNIEYALGYFQTDALAFYVENAKSQLLLQLAQQFLLENHFIEHDANDIHYANGLYNSCASCYGLQPKEDPLKHTFPLEIQHAFADYLKTAYTASSFLQMCITLFPMPPQINIDNIEGFKKLTDFFQIFEKDGAIREKYLCLYTEEDDANRNITLVPKVEFLLYYAALLANYLEAKCYLKGLHYKVNQHTYLYNGEALIGVNQDGTYRALKDEELLSPQMADIVNTLFLWSQLTAETLLKLYQDSNVLSEKERYFTTLLSKPHLPEPVLKTLVEMSQESPVELSKVANYVFTNAHYELTEKELTSLASAVTDAKNNNCIIELIRLDRALYIKCMLLQNPELSAAISKKLPAYAAMYGAINVLEILAFLNVSLTEFDENDMSPACYAASCGQTAALVKLFDLNVSLVLGNRSGLTPAHYAALEERGVCLEKLYELDIPLNQKCKFGITPAHIAASTGKINVLAKLHALHVPLDTKDNNGATPAHCAVIEHQIKSLLKLHQLHISLIEKNHHGDTPGHVAAAYGYIDVIETLHTLGMDWDLENSDFYTPVHIAATMGYGAIIDKFVELKLAFKANSKGVCLAHVAAKYGQIIILEKLKELNILLDVKDNNGATPAHYAAGDGQVEALEKLYAFGVPLTTKDNDGNTPAHWAKSSGANNSLNKLRELGINIPLDIKCITLSVTSWFFQSHPRNPAREEPQNRFCIIS